MCTIIIWVPVNIDCVRRANSTRFHQIQCTDHRRTERESLESVYFPASVTEIGEDIFGWSDGVTVCGPAGSAIEAYAEQYGLDFVVLEAS